MENKNPTSGGTGGADQLAVHKHGSGPEPGSTIVAPDFKSTALTKQSKSLDK